MVERPHACQRCCIATWAAAPAAGQRRQLHAAGAPAAALCTWACCQTLWATLCGPSQPAGQGRQLGKTADGWVRGWAGGHASLMWLVKLVSPASLCHMQGAPLQHSTAQHSTALPARQPCQLSSTRPPRRRPPAQRQRAAPSSRPRGCPALACTIPGGQGQSSRPLLAPCPAAGAGTLPGCPQGTALGQPSSPAGGQRAGRVYL